MRGLKEVETKQRADETRADMRHGAGDRPMTTEALLIKGHWWSNYRRWRGAVWKAIELFGDGLLHVPIRGLRGKRLILTAAESAAA